jgi:hypothetical protein
MIDDWYRSRRMTRAARSVTEGYRMYLVNRQNLLASLDRPGREGLEVYAHAKRWLLIAAEEVSFDGFRGQDYEVMSRLSIALAGRDSEAALWARVFIDLWYCSDFGGRHWDQLVARDSANARFAIEAAFWVLCVSGKDSGPALTAVLNRFRCWWVAEQVTDDGQRAWVQKSLLPGRALGRAWSTTGRKLGHPLVLTGAKHSIQNNPA